MGPRTPLSGNCCWKPWSLLWSMDWTKDIYSTPATAAADYLLILQLVVTLHSGNSNMPLDNTYFPS
jgi:hypothetical protein